MANEFQKGVHSFVQVMKEMGIEIYASAGTPTASGPIKGALCIDTTNAKIYQNTGTAAAATWNSIGDVAVAEIALAEGSILIGNVSGVGVALSAKDSGKILVGNGTTATSVAVSGDASLAANGALTVGAKAVGAAKIALTEGAVLRGAAGGAAEEVLKGTANQYFQMDGGGGFPQWTTMAGDVTNEAGTMTVSSTLVQTKEFALDKAGILAMNGTPVVVVNGQAGKVVEFLGACIISDYDTAAYTNGGDVSINEESGSAVSTVVTAANSFGAASDKLAILKPIEATYAPTAGKGLTITNATGAFTDPGTAAGVGRIRVSYRVHATGL